MDSPARRSVLLGALATTVLAACGSSQTSTGSSSGAAAKTAGPLKMSAIPDQDPEKLNRLYPTVAKRFAAATGLDVQYQPVTDYPAVVRAFEIGDVYLAWMGGLTGVQARSRVPGAQAIAQRDIDSSFHSLFIANKTSALRPFTDVGGLKELAGHSLTFGSETSTSGRLMPQYFLKQAGLAESQLKGKPGFSGSHDATIEAVASGSFEVGAVNEQVWKKAVAAGKVDLSAVVVLFETPGYADYHWLARPDVDTKFGAGTLDKVKGLLLGLDSAKPDDKAVLDLFGAATFIPTMNSNYDQIETVAKGEGLLA